MSGDMVIHARAPSGTGMFALCGAKGFVLYVSNNKNEVTCPQCLAILKGQPEPSAANSHYDAGGISTIDVLRAKLTPEQLEGYFLGTALTYLLRANFKDQYESDIGKANDYVSWLKEEVDPEDPGR